MNQGAVFKGALMSALPLTAGANADIAGLPRWADSGPLRPQIQTTDAPEAGIDGGAHGADSAAADSIFLASIPFWVGGRRTRDLS